MFTRYAQFQWEADGVPVGQNNSYTFKYSSSTKLELSCSNVIVIWEIDLTKVDSTGHTKVLSGAVFALYSPEGDNLIQYSGDPSVPATITENGTTYYLCSVEISDEYGMITWDGLVRDQYYIVEARAPDVYNLMSESIHVLKSVADTGNIIELTAENTPGVELPGNGGSGVMWLCLAGGLLIAGAGLLLWYRWRREKVEVVVRNR